MVRLVRSSLSPAREVFTDKFFISPLLTIQFLKDVMKFYYADPVTQPYISSLMILQAFPSSSNFMTIIWLFSLLRHWLNQWIDTLHVYGYRYIPDCQNASTQQSSCHDCNQQFLTSGNENTPATLLHVLNLQSVSLEAKKESKTFITKSLLDRISKNRSLINSQKWFKIFLRT